MNYIMSNFLIECLKNSVDQNFDHLCLATLKQYAFDEAAVTMLRQAMLDDEWRLLIKGKAEPIILNFKEKVAYIKILCSSPYVLDVERQAMSERVYKLVAKGLVFNDLVNRIEWGTPDATKKAQLWASISDPFNDDNLQSYYWKEDAFCQRNCQADLMQPYQDQFYLVVPMFVNFQTNTKATRFLRNNSPAARALPRDLEGFTKLLSQA